MEETVRIHAGSDSDSGQAEIPAGFVLSGVHGWLAVFISLFLLLLWKKAGERHYQQWRHRRAVQTERSQRDEEADLIREHSIQSSRQRLQAQMDAAAERHKELLLEKEEAKRKARILVYENMEKGRSISSSSSTQEATNGASSSQNKKKGDRLRGDYFPLMSSDPGSCFRSSRRGGGSGGG